MGTYGALFVDSPENTKADYENGVPIRGYEQGSSSELAQRCKVIHLLCTLGSVEKMYMPPAIDATRAVLDNQILFERIVADDLRLEPGDNVLDRYEAVLSFLAKVRIVPKKTDQLLQRLNENNQSYIRAEEEELLTLNRHCVGQKPT